MKASSLLFVALMSSLLSLGQDNSKHSLFFGTGIGIMTNSESEGYGILSGIGLQATVWHDRIRLIPQLTWGGFNNDGITDVPDVHFYSRSIKLDVNFDLLKIRSFSVIIGTGVTGNLTSGLVGTDGWHNPVSSSYFFREAHVGTNVMLGFRLYSSDKRLAYELRLFDVGFKPIESTDFVEAAILKFQVIFNIPGMGEE